MTKLKMLVVTGLAAATVGTGTAAASQRGSEISPWATTHGGGAAPYGSHLNIGSQSTGAGAGRVSLHVPAGVGAGKITFNPFSITRK
jgi:hypothetical protein